MHEHRFQGQKLRHSHPGGEVPHGYFEHPEDGSAKTLNGGDRKAVVLRYAETLGLDGEVLYRATLAAWGCMDPACMPETFDRALTVAGVVLRSAELGEAGPS